MRVFHALAALTYCPAAVAIPQATPPPSLTEAFLGYRGIVDASGTFFYPQSCPATARYTTTIIGPNTYAACHDTSTGSLAFATGCADTVLLLASGGDPITCPSPSRCFPTLIYESIDRVGVVKGATASAFGCAILMGGYTAQLYRSVPGNITSASRTSGASITSSVCGSSQCGVAHWKSTEERRRSGYIAGGVVGGLSFLIAFGLVFMFFTRQARRRRTPTTGSRTEQQGVEPSSAHGTVSESVAEDKDLAPPPYEKRPSGSGDLPPKYEDVRDRRS